MKVKRVKMGKYKIPAFSYLRFLPYKKGRKLETFFVGYKNQDDLVVDVDAKTKELVGLENLKSFTLEVDSKWFG